MRLPKHLAIILFLLSTFFIFSGEKTTKSLADIYRAGKIHLIRELTLDDSSMPENVIFEMPWNIACDYMGNVYVSDGKANNIKKFNSSGKFTKLIGREGKGPGEFNMPSLLTCARDRLIVWDLGNRRLCASTLDGEYIKSLNFLVMEGWPQKIDSLPEGDIVIERIKTYYGDPKKPQDCIIEIYSPNLEYKKTIYSKKVWHSKFITEPVRTNVPQPFTPRLCWDVSPEGKIVIGFSEKYEIEIYNTEVEKISSFTHPYEPVKVTKEDKINFFNNLFLLSPTGRKRGAPDYIEKNTKFPRYKPAFRNILLDSEGNILVFIYGEKKSDEYRYFDSFDPEGNFIRRVQVVGDTPFLDVLSSNIIKHFFWRIEKDEDDLAKIVKYRISN